MMNDKALLNRIDKIKNTKKMSRSTAMRSPMIVVADEQNITPRLKNESLRSPDDNMSAAMGTIKSSSG